MLLLLGQVKGVTVSRQLVGREAAPPNPALADDENT